MATETHKVRVVVTLEFDKQDVAAEFGVPYDEAKAHIEGYLDMHIDQKLIAVGPPGAAGIIVSRVDATEV